MRLALSLPQRFPPGLPSVTGVGQVAIELTSIVIASAAKRPNISLGTVRGPDWARGARDRRSAQREGRRLPLWRLMGLTIVALVPVALSAVSAGELGGLGVIDVVAWPWWDTFGGATLHIGLPTPSTSWWHC
jgi:hypothetical protein